MRSCDKLCDQQWESLWLFLWQLVRRRGSTVRILSTYDRFSKSQIDPVFKWVRSSIYFRYCIYFRTWMFHFVGFHKCLLHGYHTFPVALQNILSEAELKDLTSLSMPQYVSGSPFPRVSGRLWEPWKPKVNWSLQQVYFSTVQDSPANSNMLDVPAAKFHSIPKTQSF